MKRLMIMLIAMMLLAAPSMGMADDGSCVATVPGSRLHLVCTTNAAGSLDWTAPAETMRLLQRRYGLLISTYAVTGEQAFDDDSDLAITDTRGVVWVSATGHGLDKVDATATNSFYPEGPNGDHWHEFQDELQLRFVITGNDNDSAVISIDIDTAAP